jgi:hypothetical protein
VSAPFNNSDALTDGWGYDSAEDELRRREEVEIAIEVPSQRTREIYRDLGPDSFGHTRKSGERRCTGLAHDQEVRLPDGQQH